jgi:hypothetical protein
VKQATPIMILNLIKRKLKVTKRIILSNLDLWKTHFGTETEKCENRFRKQDRRVYNTNISPIDPNMTSYHDVELDFDESTIQARKYDTLQIPNKPASMCTYFPNKSII